MSSVMSIKAPWKGKRLSVEHRRKISMGVVGKRIGKKYSKSSIEKMKLAKRGKNNPNYGKVRDKLSRDKSAISNGAVTSILQHVSGNCVVVSNYHEFEREHGLNHRRVGELIRGNRKSHKGWSLYKTTNTFNLGKW
jgi:hypothetical protein